MAFAQKARVFITALIGLGIIAVSLAYFSFCLNRPYMGLDLAKQDRAWQVQAVDSTGLASARGIRPGDTPVTINGEPAALFLAKYEQEGLAWGPLIHQLTVENGQGQLITVDLQGAGQSAGSLAELGLRFVACLIFWAIGIYVFLRKPHSLPASLFYLCCLTIGLVLSSNLASVRGVLTAVPVEIVFTVVGPWLLLHFFLVLPEERTALARAKGLYLIYLPALVTLVLFPFIGYVNGQPVSWFRSLRLLEYGLGFLACLLVAILNYFLSRSLKTRQQMKIVFISALCALVPLVIINVLPQAIWGHQTVLPAGFSILVILFIPAGFGYAVLNRQLLDIDVVIRRGVIYGFVTLVSAAVLFIAIFAVLSIDQSLGLGGEILLAVGLAVLATALFGPTKAGIELLVDKYLYKDRYDYRQIIHSLGLSLNTARDLTSVSRLFVGSAANALNLAGACLIARTQAGTLETAASQGSCNNADIQRRLLEFVRNRDRTWDFPNQAASGDLDLSYIIPLRSGDKEIGVLCLSQKITRQVFSPDDLFLLQGIASLASMAVSSAMLVQDVSTRDTFVSVASHELRSPLTTILGYTDLLLNRDPPEAKRKAWLNSILGNARTVAALVDDLLNVTRIRSGKLVMKLEASDLSDILANKMELAPEISEKHHFVIDLPADLPKVLVDRSKLGQVIDNLISNAIKYSPAGGEIRLAARQDPASRQVVISLQDHGIGISPADSESLFTTFHRIKRPETEGVKGNGLGLYIAKEWTEAMGGKIWLTSRLNEGSTFWVAVPVAETDHLSGEHEDRRNIEEVVESK